MPCLRRVCLSARTRGVPRERGFTLIEVLIAMVVLAILAATAYPLYTEFVRRSKIMEATSTMNDYRVRMEQFFQDNRRYNSAGTTCGVLDPVTNGNFTFACTNATATGYTLDATGVSAKGMGAFGYQLQVAPGGVTRSTTSVYSGWTAASNCWTVRKNGDCQ